MSYKRSCTMMAFKSRNGLNILESIIEETDNQFISPIIVNVCKYKTRLGFTPSQRWRSTAASDPFPYSTPKCSDRHESTHTPAVVEGPPAYESPSLSPTRVDQATTRLTDSDIDRQSFADYHYFSPFEFDRFSTTTT